MPKPDEAPERGQSAEAHAAHPHTWTLVNDATGDTKEVDDWRDNQHAYMADGWHVQDAGHDPDDEES